MAKKPRKQPARPRRVSGPRGLHVQLGAVEALLDARQWEDADELLTRLEQHHPRNADVLRLRVALAAHVQDLPMYQAAAEELLRLTPDDADLTVLLAGAYAATLRLALAVRT